MASPCVSWSALGASGRGLPLLSVSGLPVERLDDRDRVRLRVGGELVLRVSCATLGIGDIGPLAAAAALGELGAPEPRSADAVAQVHRGDWHLGQGMIGEQRGNWLGAVTKPFLSMFRMPSHLPSGDFFIIAVAWTHPRKGPKRPLRLIMGPAALVARNVGVLVRVAACPRDRRGRRRCRWGSWSRRGSGRSCRSGRQGLSCSTGRSDIPSGAGVVSALAWVMVSWASSSALLNGP